MNLQQQEPLVLVAVDVGEVFVTVVVWVVPDPVTELEVVATARGKGVKIEPAMVLNSRGKGVKKEDLLNSGFGAALTTATPATRGKIMDLSCMMVCGKLLGSLDEE
jgi:hypothetical protein